MDRTYLDNETWRYFWHPELLPENRTVTEATI